MLFIIQSGWTSELLDEHFLMKPNEGIWLSARHSVQVAVIFGVVSGLMFLLLADPLHVWAHEGVTGFVTALFDGLIRGAVIGFAAGLLSGGIACARHALLRWRLCLAGSIPWNYTRFLDDAATRVLLYKSGGGYVFFHRLLLEYFASSNVASFSQRPAK